MNGMNSREFRSGEAMVFWSESKVDSLYIVDISKSKKLMSLNQSPTIQNGKEVYVAEWTLVSPGNYELIAGADHFPFVVNKYEQVAFGVELWTKILIVGIVCLGVILWSQKKKKKNVV